MDHLNHYPRARTLKGALGFTYRHWREQPARLFFIIALILLAAIADVLTPWFAGRLVDAVAMGLEHREAAWAQAMQSFWVLTGLALGGALLLELSYLHVVTLSLKMMTAIASRAFHRVQRLSTDWHANSFAGSTVRKITRGMWAMDILNDTVLTSLLPSFAILVGATLALSWQWPIMGLVVGLGSLLYVSVTIAISLGYVAPAARLSNAWDTRLGGVLADAVTCNAVVKAYGAEAREEARFARTLMKWRDRTRRGWIRASVNGGIQGVILAAMQITIIGLALHLWAAGRASVGDITFALTMFFILQGYLRDIGMHVRHVQRSVNDMEELVALDAQPLGVEDLPDAVPLRVHAGEIRFEHVTFLYGGHDTPLYHDFSVCIRPGERVGLVGQSGSGKTTLVKLIQRLYDVQAGRITIDGQNIARVQQASLRAQIAIVQQDPVLFHRTLAENIAYARPGATRAEIESAARLASAHDFIAALPKGYDTVVGERGVKLSGGERQRVAIARAFLADAPILILDEATSSLDSESEALIQQAMERLMAGRTTLVVAHRLSTVRAMDRLLVMERGRIIEEGSHEQLAQRPGGRYRRLLETQTGKSPSALGRQSRAPGGPA
jgi:ATP-binding cassette subfamily B protein